MAPAWMDQVPGVDFSPEKAAFQDIVDWANAIGLDRVPEDQLESDVRSTTDQVYRLGRQQLYVKAQPKRQSGQGRIDLDARPALRHVRLLWRPEERLWEAINDSNMVEDVPWTKEGFERLVSRLFNGR